jgi:D-alanyl-lipoteichoic acid acyltransferase DltB (MBOAT superfamily)
MLFNTFEFVVFLGVVLTLYFAIAQRYKKYFVLAASYYFYMCWRWDYIVLILASTVIDYYAAIQINKQKETKSKKYFLYR